MTNFYRLISLLLLTSLRIFLPFSTRNIGRLRERLSEPHVVAAAALAVSSSLVPTYREKRSDRPLNSGQFQFPFTPTSFSHPFLFSTSPLNTNPTAPPSTICVLSRDFCLCHIRTTRMCVVQCRMFVFQLVQNFGPPSYGQVLSPLSLIRSSVVKRSCSRRCRLEKSPSYIFSRLSIIVANNSVNRKSVPFLFFCLRCYLSVVKFRWLNV